MSDKRRERLLEIQKREQLKGMLINKFKVKYGEKPAMSKYIDNEVGKFLKNGRLTEDNLRNLDTKIGKEADLRDKREDILADRKSNAGSVRSKKSSHSAMNNNADARSTHSRASNRSVNSRASQRSKQPAADQVSVASSMRSRHTEAYSELAEEDEWTAIQKFNTLLHYEEQKQALVRDQERRRLIREELDKQIKEKRAKEEAEKVERAMYEELTAQHVKLLGQREQEKADQIRNQIMAEKESRDRQLKEEKLRKRAEEKEAFKSEVELVTRLKEEMEVERKLQADKRRQEREYLQRMMRENEANKAQAEEEKKEETLADIKAQEEYARMLDKQEADRQREFQARENRAQKFMNKMATGVIAKQQSYMKHEEQMIARYEAEREMRERLNEEKKAAMARREKDEMRALLAKQMEEKNAREQAEKAQSEEQARIWATDKQNYETEEARLQQKIKNINRENQEFLRKQMEDKKRTGVMRKMNRQEFAYNKPLLKEINDKRKTDSQYTPSNADAQSQQALQAEQ